MKKIIEKVKGFEQFDWLMVASVCAIIGGILVWQFLLPHQPPYVEKPEPKLILNPDYDNE